MNNLLIAIAVFVITVVGSLFAVPHFIDWNSYRSIFEEEASRIVGREVQVDGDANLYLLPTPYFRLEKVRIADPSKSLAEPFFRTESLTIKLSIAPMFRGIVEATDIEFQRPALHLAMDAKDGWNWQGFVQALGSYMPSNVTLTSLKIADGTLALHGPDGVERARLEGLNGELSAPSLQGPYRFRGDFVSGGQGREVRLSTAASEPDGSVRFRASLRLMDSGTTYLLDARVADLMGKPRVEGDLTARLPLVGLWQGGTAPRKSAGPNDEHQLDRTDAGFEAKAVVKADAAGAGLSDLALTFEQDGRPQIVTGSARANWRNALALDMTLSSRWLDLDSVAGATKGAGPVDSITKFAAGLRDVLPGEGPSRVKVSIDQANLGGDTVGAIRLSLTRWADKLEIDELQARLPGGSRMDLKGSFSGRKNALALSSSLALRGTSLARFMTWATGNTVAVDSKGDGAFALRAQIAVGAGQLVVQDLVGNLSGSALNGSATYRWGERPELLATFESPLLDARAFVPAGTSVADVFDFLVHGPKPSDARGISATRPGWRGAQSDLRLRLKAGQLITAARTYRDVTASMDLKGGHLEQVLLRLAGDDGYTLELEGRIEDAATRPKGSLRGAVSADTAAGVAPLAELLGMPLALRPGEVRSQAMAPLRLAGSVAFGRTPTSADLMVDGEANGAVVKFTGRFDSGASGWRGGRTEATATVDSGDAAKIASLLFGDEAAGRAEGAGPGRILVRVSGVPSEGLVAFATLETGDVGLNFRGQLTATEADTKAAGDLEVRAKDGMRLATLAGLAPPLKFDRMPVNARMKLSLGAGAIGIDKLALQVGGSQISGQIKLSPKAEQRRRIEARLDIDEVTLARLLGPVLDQQFAIADQAEAAILGRANAWPDTPFSSQVLEGFEGSIRLSCRRLALAEGIALEGAKLDIELAAGQLEIKEIVGNGLGGQFRGRVRIDRSPAGADLQGTLTFGIALEDFPTGTPPRASGPVFGTIEFNGRGRSPRAVVSALQGQGKIEFGDAKLTALWPGAVAAAAEAALKVEPDKLGSTVRQGLAAGLAGGVLPVERKVFAVEIADGQLRVKAPVIDTGDGRVSGVASLDLRALSFESRWRIEGKAPETDAAGKQLPGVTVIYRGPVASLGVLEPRIDSAALEQELSARKIERDMEELDRLRKMDEQRRLNEVERIRKQFDQVPPVPRPPPPGVPVAPSVPKVGPATPG